MLSVIMLNVVAPILWLSAKKIERRNTAPATQ